MDCGRCAVLSPRTSDPLRGKYGVRVRGIVLIFYAHLVLLTVPPFFNPTHHSHPSSPFCFFISLNICYYHCVRIIMPRSLLLYSFHFRYGFGRCICVIVHWVYPSTLFVWLHIGSRQELLFGVPPISFHVCAPCLKVRSRLVHIHLCTISGFC